MASITATQKFTVGQAVRYTGETDVAPVNRTVAAPYGFQPDMVSFRRYDMFGNAEVMTSHGTKIVDPSELVAVEV